MRVVRLMDEPDWQSRLSPIEEIFFATMSVGKDLAAGRAPTVQGALAGALHYV